MEASIVFLLLILIEQLCILLFIVHYFESLCGVKIAVLHIKNNKWQLLECNFLSAQKRELCCLFGVFHVPCRQLSIKYNLQ